MNGDALLAYVSKRDPTGCGPLFRINEFEGVNRPLSLQGRRSSVFTLKVCLDRGVRVVVA
jgi:hypothetical protein